MEFWSPAQTWYTHIHICIKRATGLITYEHTIKFPRKMKKKKEVAKSNSKTNHTFKQK